MRIFYKTILILSFFLFLFSFKSEYLSAEQSRAFIAVLDLEIKGGVTKDESSLLSDQLREVLFHTERYRVVDRKNMENILEEQGFQLSDCSSEECAVKIGKVLGVEKMVLGSIGKLGDIYVISVQLVDVETGEIEQIASEKSPGPMGKLIPCLEKVAEKISEVKITGPAEENPEPQKISDGVTLTVESDPPGASINLDGNTIDGVTPFTFNSAEPGSHKVILEKGTLKGSTEVEIEPGKPKQIFLKLEESLPPSLEMGSNLLLSIKKSRQKSNIISISGVGVAVTSSSLAIIFDHQADIARGHYDKANNTDAAVDARNDIGTYNNLVKASWIVAGVSLAASLVSWLIKPKLPDHNEDSARPLTPYKSENDQVGIYLIPRNNVGEFGISWTF
jgi:TolB-like protein